MKRAIRELRILASEFLISCALDVAPRDSRLRYELKLWMTEYTDGMTLTEATQRVIDDLRKQIHENHSS